MQAGFNASVRWAAAREGRWADGTSRPAAACGHCTVGELSSASAARARSMPTSTALLPILAAHRLRYEDPTAQPSPTITPAGLSIYTSQPTRRYRSMWLRSQTRPCGKFHRENIYWYHCAPSRVGRSRPFFGARSRCEETFSTADRRLPRCTAPTAHEHREFSR